MSDRPELSFAGSPFGASPSFLDLVRRAIYENPRSPYRELLLLAGCGGGSSSAPSAPPTC